MCMHSIEKTAYLYHQLQQRTRTAPKEGTKSNRWLTGPHEGVFGGGFRPGAAFKLSTLSGGITHIIGNIVFGVRFWSLLVEQHFTYKHIIILLWYQKIKMLKTVNDGIKRIFQNTLITSTTYFSCVYSQKIAKI